MRVTVDLVSVGLITVSTMIYQSSEDHDIYADITFVKLQKSKAIVRYQNNLHDFFFV